MGTDSNGDQVIAVKSWQAFLGILTLAGSIVLSYAFTKAQTEQNTQDIRHIQEETVKKEQLEDIKSRLDRIERKIDRQEERTVSHR